MEQAFEKFDLTGKTAFVTGGGTGLGYFMSRGLIRSGATVMIASRRPDVLAAACERLKSESDRGDALWCQVDLSSRRSVAEASAHAISTMGGVDIFVGNAAQEGLEPIEAMRDETITDMLQLNVAANMALTRDFVPQMRARKWGRVIFSSSNMSRCVTAGEGACSYATVKGALNAFTRAAAVEVGRDGITVNSLILGLHLTDIIQGIVDDLSTCQGPEVGRAFIDDFVRMTAVGRIGECDDVEGTIQLLASEAGRYITGSELTIDGGMCITAKPNPVVTAEPVAAPVD